jgi:hypothetical protein
MVYFNSYFQEDTVMFGYIHWVWVWLMGHGYEVWSNRSEGRVDEIIKAGKIWRIWHQASLWTARSEQPLDLHPGDWVRVVARRGLTLMIEPIEREEP